MMCIDNENLIYYSTIKGKDNALDLYMNNLSGYNTTQFIDKGNYGQSSNLLVYNDNFIDDQYISITNYRGLYETSKNFNSTVHSFTLFDKDIYNQKLGVFVDKYYIVADYNNNYNFNEFIIIDLETLEDRKKSLELDSKSKILCISTEGNTDNTSYNTIVNTN